ncbi:FtsX-like permease family protein [Limibaculum sp. FT325]|uniref:ABC transporter permease n=1 Tax=Thermohalobaculum sediminis TaxID=2939436 RepID=UPI0020C05C05|nr:FtsX-like permease family protein [Limibaculum sediminis]MCL5775773.1 FtsX-like permease family protein [Limibaculum sediminis]
MGFASRLARRELRGGLAGFRIFLLCLALGVAGIAAVGSVTAAIRAGLAAEGQAILGGDVAITFTYRAADEAERAWIEGAGPVAEVFDLRSMLGTTEGERALAQVKGVDGAYPLYGAVEIEGTDLTGALAQRDGAWGLVAEPVLAERLGLTPGQRVRLGAGEFEYRGALLAEPDRLSGGFALGPRVIVASEGLRAAGLLGPGTLYETIYRLRVAEGIDLVDLRASFEAAFPYSGARWRDRTEAAPGIARFVTRAGAFLTLVGLAALVVGGVGVGAAVRGYLARKLGAIATLRTLGASADTVFAAYLMQIGAISALGIGLGVALGGGLVALAGPWMAGTLPLPARFALYPAPLALAAVYGAGIAALFALGPLMWLREIRPAALYRAAARVAVRGRGGIDAWPHRAALVVVGGLGLGLAALVVALSGAPKLALGVIGAIAGAMAVLRGAGWLAARGARRLAHGPIARNRPGLRLALGAIGAPGGGAANVVMALGLGLGVLAAIGQIDANMQRLIRSELPQDAPAFFFVDIQPDQLAPFRAMVEGTDGVSRIATAPMLRGVVTHLNGIPAAEAPIDPAGAWVLRGDRGVSYAATPPPGARIVEGAWWSEAHAGEPQVSFAAEEARELGLGVGSTVTVNILGRPVTARVANLREVDWRSLGISFLMVLSPDALAGAPHTHIATVHAAPGAEATLMRETGRDFPNVTAIRVRDQIERVSDGLATLGAATRWGALAVLLTGLAVLVGAAGAAAERQVSEAAVMKVLGAPRRRILGSFALRALALGAVAGLVALIWGTLAAWAVTHFVLDADFTLRIGPALAVVLGGAALNLLAGLTFSARPLRLRPARVLRMAAG